MYGLGIFLLFFAWIVFFAPNFFGEPDNYIPADPLVTPAHIVPEWYFLPFYAILRSIPDKLAGVIGMFGSIVVLFLLPWLDRSPVRSGIFRSFTFKALFWLLILDCILLGIVGAKPPEGWWLITGRLATAWYFAHFLVFIPLVSIFERPKPLPHSISEPVLQGGGVAAGAVSKPMEKA
jgi:ubiquinol-cytochrome c reductase cytochrome b subunit